MKHSFSTLPFLSILALILFGTTAHAQIPSYVPTNGMQAWWGFNNGSPNDATTNLNNFINYGATPASDRFGNANSAVSFNGTNQYMQCPTPGFQFGSTSAFTISFWMNRPALGYGVALMHGTSTNGNFIWNFQTNTTNGIQFGTNKQGSAWTWAPGTYTAGSWHHVLATFQSGVMTLYLNGIQTATATYPHTGAVQTTLPLWLGRGVGGAYFSGSIDDIGIWNRALTAAEINSLFAGCSLSVTQQPAAFQGTIGGNATFQAAASVSSASYQWQEEINGTWTALSNTGTYSGTATGTLTLTGLTGSFHGRNYRCLISSGSCGDTSQSATLNVCGTFTAAPIATSAVVFANASFSASSNDPNASFAWVADTGTGWVSAAGLPGISGSNTANLTWSNLQLSWDQSLVACVQQSGNCSDTSSSALLTVINNIGHDEWASGFTMFPNPSTGMVRWNRPLPTAVEAVLRNAHGAEISRILFPAGSTQWDLGRQPCGSYFLEFNGTVQRIGLMPE